MKTRLLNSSWLSLARDGVHVLVVWCGFVVCVREFESKSGWILRAKALPIKWRGGWPPGGGGGLSHSRRPRWVVLLYLKRGGKWGDPGIVFCYEIRKPGNYFFLRFAFRVFAIFVARILPQITPPVNVFDN